MAVLQISHSPKRAPFPWFGGKSKAAPMIWDAFGKVGNYIEPFAGSLATLLARPWQGQRLLETVNDRDGMICNFWRAVAHDAGEVAAWCDWPVNELDLTARHLWLVQRIPEVTARLESNPEFYDAKVAGWWCWGLNAWIGSGWCSGDGPWTTDGEKVLRNPGQGVNRQLPHLRNPGQGVNRQLPHLGNPGQGVNRQLPHLGDPGRGVIDWFEWLSLRLRWTRVCCGDWSRVLTHSVVRCGSPCAVLLDPPYNQGQDYAHGEDDIAGTVAQWAFENGDREEMRIVLCGHSGQHQAPSNWAIESWERKGGYDNLSGEKKKSGEFMECLWMSPGCRPSQGDLFA